MTSSDELCKAGNGALELLLADFREVQEALALLDGIVRVIAFDPNDAVSVRRAICAMEAAVRKSLERYKDNQLLPPTMAEAAEAYRRQIVGRNRSD